MIGFEKQESVSDYGKEFGLLMGLKDLWTFRATCPRTERPLSKTARSRFGRSASDMGRFCSADHFRNPLKITQPLLIPLKKGIQYLACMMMVAVWAGEARGQTKYLFNQFYETPSLVLNQPRAVNFKNIKPSNELASENMTLLGRWATGPCRVMRRVGNILYASNGPSFDVIDISDPSRPQQCNTIMTSSVIAAITICENRLLVLSDGEFSAYSIQNSLAPELLGSCNIEPFCVLFDSGLEMVVYSDRAYYTAFGSLNAIDISDLCNPRFIGLLLDNSYTLASNEDVLCVGGSNPSLKMFRTDVGELNLVGSLDLADQIFNVTFADSMLYLLGRSLYIVNVSNPQQPELVSRVAVNGRGVYRMAISDNKLYTVWGRDGIRITDISDLNNPHDIAALNNLETLSDICLHGGIIVVAAGYYGVHILEEREDSLCLQVTYRTGGCVRGLDFEENYLYAATLLNGMQIIDVQEPDTLNVIGNYRDIHLLNEKIAAVDVSGDYAYLAAGPYGLIVCDISDRSFPIEVNRYFWMNDSGRTPVDIIVRNEYAYVGLSVGGIRILDVSDPTDLYEVGSLFMEDARFSEGLCLTGNYLYRADDIRGLRIIDISDPTNPFLVGGVGMNDNKIATNVDVFNGYAYVAYSEDQLIIIDVRNPYNPEVVEFYACDPPIDSVVEDICISGNFAYLAYGWRGLEVLDLSNPTSPKKVASFNTSYYSNTVTIHDSIVYIGDHDNGVYMVRNDLLTSVEQPPTNYPHKAQMLSCYPNPFNATIIFMYDLPEDAQVSIRVFDLGGREVAALVNGDLKAGTHSVTWNAEGFTSGVYLIRMEAPSFSETKKVTLVR